MQSIFDIVTAGEIAAYWTNLDNEEEYMNELLFPPQQKLGLKLEWVEGVTGLPVVLLPSAYDVVSKKRDFVGFDSVIVNMPYFKESVYIDEETRQQLNMVLETGNRAYIFMIIENVFDRTADLLRAARAQRERICMQLVTTGAVSIRANGQDYDYNYGFGADQLLESKLPWSNPKADIGMDITAMIDAAEANGYTVTRAICSNATFNYILQNEMFRAAIWGNDSNAPVSKAKMKAYIEAEYKIKVEIYNKKYKDEGLQERQFVPDDVFVCIPSGKLGTGWFGTTPEQSDLNSLRVANVAIVDVGVAVTTSASVDPVNVDTKVSMIYLPSFERGRGVIIMDTAAGEESDNDDSNAGDDEGKVA